MSIDYRPPLGPLDIVHIDEALIVVEKLSGLLTVPGRGEARQDCLIHRVQKDYPEALTVHRLDMATSGLVLLARGADMQRELSRLFMQRSVEKRYEAVVAGLLEHPSGQIELPLICDWPNRPRQKVDFDIGKHSLTFYERLKLDRETYTSRVALKPVTGRSHQLRVHLDSIGHPILGDDLYGDDVADPLGRLLLHATDLTFTHPLTAQTISFHSAVPF